MKNEVISINVNQLQVQVMDISKTIIRFYEKTIHGQNALSSNGIESDTII